MARKKPDELISPVEYPDLQHDILPPTEAQATPTHAATETRAGHSPEERAKKIFLKNPLLVIEDDDSELEQIKFALASVEKNDFLIAKTTEETEQRMDTLLTTINAGGRIFVISDLCIPAAKKGRAQNFHGVRALVALQEKVSEWNAAHVDQPPITLEIMMNSSQVSDIQKFKENYRQDFPNPNTLVASNHWGKQGCVDEFIKYLIAKEERERE